MTETAPAGPHDRTSVLANVRLLLEDIVDEDLFDDEELTLDTNFVDLDLESIEFVELAEALQEHYGRRFDFVTWFETLEFTEIVDMSAGTLVDFVLTCLE